MFGENTSFKLKLSFDLFWNSRRQQRAEFVLQKPRLMECLIVITIRELENKNDQMHDSYMY